MILRSWAWIKGKRELYQEGTLEAMLPVKELLAKGFEGGKLPDGCVMFGGTLAAKGGIRPAERFEFELEDPVLKRTIRHAYDYRDAAGAGIVHRHCGAKRRSEPGISACGVMDCFASLAMTGKLPEIGWRKRLGCPRLWS